MRRTSIFVVILNTVLTALSVLVVVLLFKALFDNDNSGKVDDKEFNDKISTMAEDLTKFVEDATEKLDPSLNDVNINITTGKKSKTINAEKISRVNGKFRGGEEFTISVEYSGKTEMSPDDVALLLQKVIDEEAGKTYKYFKDTFANDLIPSVTELLEFHELKLVEIKYTDNIDN